MKKFRLMVVLLVCFLVIGTLFGCDSIPNAQEEYPEGDPNIAGEKYNQLLMEWAYDKNYPNDVYADFPEFYGGAYIGDHGNLVILLTKQDKETTAYFENLIGLENVVFETVKFSYQTLVAESDAAVATREDVNAQYYGAISSLGISVPDNAINIYINKNIVESYDLDIQQICTALTSFPNVCVVEVAGYDEPA